MQNYAIPEVIKDIYENDPQKPLGNEDILAYVSDKPNEYVPYTGILVYIQGATYPKKGFPMPESVAAINIIKKLIIESFRFPLIFVLYKKEKLFNTFNTIFKKTFHQYTIKDIYLCPTAYNFSQFLFNLTQNLEFSHNVAQILEYDDAYRYRLQDILSEMSLQLLQNNPRKEINRLLSILKERESPHSNTATRITKIVRPLTLLLLVPPIKKAFIQASPYLERMKYDDADRYWACLKGDEYLFTGKPYEERTKGLQIPQAVKVLY